ncbi:amino acid permease [Qipengyuania marisflavi]|uniref:Arginine/agmatine antiporter n=1 Tax=Qipengyuania marisflavi TaxID=2486356 RepID=A0A5S3P8B9_9SPHN|nr:amino acid permease [Qipengyuania marisflavi]TMM47182.1 amino acid permease [Qipengyuania marisflavi]
MIASAPVTPDNGGAGRKLGLVAATALVMGNMIGSGVFLLPASLAPFGWNAVLGWIVTIVGTLILAWVLAALTRARPLARDPAGFVTEAFGELPAFLVYWIYWVSVWTAVVSIAVAAVSYLSSFFPAIGATPFMPALCSIALVWAMTLLNLRGVRAAGDFQVVTVVLKIMPLIAVIIIAGVALGDGSANIRPFAIREINGVDLRGAAALTLFALLGFECASLAAARVENPQVNVPRATMWGTALTGLLYLLVCSAIALMLPEAVASSSSAPFATFVEQYWSTGAAALIALFAIISCVGALNGWVLVQGELPRNLAARGLLPRWFGGTDLRGTPVRALLASSVIATLCLLFNSSRSMQGIYEFVLLLSTSAALWLYLACALAAWKMRVVRVFALIGAVYALWTLWGAGVEASGWSLVLMLAGLPLYWWGKREAATSQEPA